MITYTEKELAEAIWAVDNTEYTEGMPVHSWARCAKILAAELDEWHNAAKFVADGCTDEIHCGCVPILKRELDRQKHINSAVKHIDDMPPLVYFLMHPEDK